VRAQTDQGLAVELDCAAPRAEEAHRRLHERGLAHPVLAEQCDGLALAYLERHPEEDRRRAVPGVDFAKTQHRVNPWASVVGAAEIGVDDAGIGADHVRRPFGDLLPKWSTAMRSEIPITTLMSCSISRS